MRSNCVSVFIVSLIVVACLIQQGSTANDTVEEKSNGTLPAIKSRCLFGLIPGFGSATNSTTRLVSTGGLFSPFFNFFGRLRDQLFGTITSVPNSNPTTTLFSRG
uniref:Secreted protein n=1 Tax=Tetranychus urticae TaxID=32264 RepID=T1JTA0_TETUR